MRVNRQTKQSTLLENLTDDAIASFYVTKFSTISLYLTKLLRHIQLWNSVISYIQRNPPKIVYWYIIQAVTWTSATCW